jgi:hypothetical protein
MSKGKRLVLPALVAGLATILMGGCGSGMGGGNQNTTSGPTGSVVVFGTDQPSCDVESFMVTISAASLVGGTTSATLTPPSGPVDFAGLVDFTNILSFGSVTSGTYNELDLTLTTPVLTYLNTSVSPPAAVTLPSCSAATTTNCTYFSNYTPGSSTAPVNTITLNLLFSPPLVVPTSTTTTGTTVGFALDFDMRDSVQTGTNGLITGVVDPQVSITQTTLPAEADTLYGLVATPTTACTANSSITGDFGCFSLQVQGGVGQILTIQLTSTTDFEGDITPTGTGATAVPAALTTAGTFVEVDATIDTSGDIIATEVDGEEQTASSSSPAGFLGEIIGVTRASDGVTATGFNLLVGHETRDVTSEVPLQSSLAVTLADTTRYWTNWHHWNRESLQFGPQTLGPAQKVAVFGTLQAGTPPTLAGGFVFLRQRNVLGTFVAKAAVGSDNSTGGFTMQPCGPLFLGQTITVLTFGDGRWRDLGGLSALTPGPIIDVAGLLFYEQSSGSANGVSWTVPPNTWVLETKVVHQLPQ